MPVYRGEMLKVNGYITERHKESKVEMEDMLEYLNKQLQEANKKKADILEPILISLMFLTKQTLGILVIPSIIFSKNNKDCQETMSTLLKHPTNHAFYDGY